jgi:hypothetical protein
MVGWSAADPAGGGPRPDWPTGSSGSADGGWPTVAGRRWADHGGWTGGGLADGGPTSGAPVDGGPDDGWPGRRAGRDRAGHGGSVVGGRSIAGWPMGWLAERLVSRPRSTARADRWPPGHRAGGPVGPAGQWGWRANRRAGPGWLARRSAGPCPSGPCPSGQWPVAGMRGSCACAAESCRVRAARPVAPMLLGRVCVRARQSAV